MSVTIVKLIAENARLRTALVGAWVDYDHLPYEMATEEYDRIETWIHWPYTVPLYLMDDQAVDDVATRETFEEHEKRSAKEREGLMRELAELERKDKT